MILVNLCPYYTKHVAFGEYSIHAIGYLVNKIPDGSLVKMLFDHLYLISILKTQFTTVQLTTP
jgi:hypothetical protein